MDNEECCHLLPPGQCAYCSGSWRREQNAIAREQASIAYLVSRKQNAWSRAVTRNGWTTA